jgi:myo-inositol-1(or 4)-monophosphatase
MTTKEQFMALIQTIEDVSVAARAYFDSDDFSNNQKADGSVVTKVDQEIESAIRNFVRTNFPDDTIIGEEEEDVQGTSSYVWHIDPIDGTDNFLRKIPFCAVSVARLGDTEAGSFAIVHNPITSHTFTAFETEGAKENGHPVSCYPEPLGGRYVVALGRGRELWMKQAGNAIIAACGNEFGKGAAYGSAALEIAYVAAGRIDAYLTFGLSSYDYAAGLY